MARAPEACVGWYHSIIKRAAISRITQLYDDISSSITDYIIDYIMTITCKVSKQHSIIVYLLTILLCKVGLYLHDENHYGLKYSSFSDFDWYASTKFMGAGVGGGGLSFHGYSGITHLTITTNNISCWL